jgi:hypothetical protein
MKEKWIRCLKVEPGKIPEECTLENTLSAMQEAVDGLIELLDMEELGDGLCVTMLCNEEGKLNGMEGNRRWQNDIICGTFYVMASNAEGELVSLPDCYMEKYANHFHEPESFDASEISNALFIRFFAD